MQALPRHEGAGVGAVRRSVERNQADVGAARVMMKERCRAHAGGARNAKHGAPTRMPPAAPMLRIVIVIHRVGDEQMRAS